MFSGCRERVHWEQMGKKKTLDNQNRELPNVNFWPKLNMANSAYKRPVKFEAFSQFVYFMFVLDLWETLKLSKTWKYLNFREARTRYKQKNYF